MATFIDTNTTSASDPVVRKGPRVYLPDGRDTRTVTVAWLTQHTNVRQAAQLWQSEPGARENEVETPWKGGYPEPGTWRFNPQMRQWEVFLHLDPAAVFIWRPLADIRSLPSYRTYRAWTEQGHMPPPISVVRRFFDGALNTGDERRVVVARDLKLRVAAWFSETTIYGRSFWRLPDDILSLAA